MVRLPRLVPLVLVLASLLALVAPPESAGAAARSNKKKASTAKAAPTPASVEVSVLYTTDLHGHLLPWDYGTGAEDPEIGLSKIATLVGRVRKEVGEDHTLLVDAGDCIQGTPLSYLHNVGGVKRTAGGDGRPDPQMACMNAMRYTTFTVGNHEYNFGLEVLARAHETAKFPWLSANTLKLDPAGAGAYQAYHVAVVDGVRIGILGLTTPGVPTWDDPKNYAGLRFEDPLETAKRFVPILRGMERCDAVVIVCHMGLEEDDTGRLRPGQAPNENRVLAIARGVPGVDAIVMGHTHVRIESKLENGVLLTQSGKWGEALGRMDLRFERNPGGKGYRLADKRSRLYDVDPSVASDPAIAQIAKPYHDAIEGWLSTVIAQAADSLAGDDARVRDNPLHELIHKAQLDAGRADVSLSAMFNPRVRIARGPITVRDAFALNPYENTLAVLEIDGQILKDALEHASRYYNQYDFGRSDLPFVNRDVAGYNYDTAEGVTYTLDLRKPVGERVQNLRFQGKPLDMKQSLRLAVNNYRVNGGGGYDMLKRGKEISRSGVQTRDLLIDYMRKTGKLTAQVDQNWRLVPEWGGEPSRLPLELLVRRGIIAPDSALAFGPDAPVSRARFFRWATKASSDPGALARDPWAGWSPRVQGLAAAPPAKNGSKKDKSAKPAQPPMDVPLDLELGLVWSLRALPATARQAPAASANSLTTLSEMGFKGGAASASLSAPLAEEAGRLDLLADLPHEKGLDPAGLTVSQAASVLAASVYPRLSILHMTDFHGALLPGQKDRASGRPIGSAAVLAAYIARERAKNPEGTLLTDGGDWMQGTPISNLGFGRAVVEMMNRLGTDASAIGNHEFDWTADTLWARMSEARFATLGANWFDRATNQRVAGVAPWKIFERRGIDVGVIGVLTPTTPSVTLPQNVAAYTFPEPSTIANGLMDSLRAAGADLTILIGHIPGRQDSTGAVSGELAELAQKTRGEAAVFGGHSHNKVNGVVDGTPVLISAASGTTLGRLDLVVDRRALRVVPEETRGTLLTTFADDVRPDKAMASFVESVNASIAPLTARVLGQATTTLTRSRDRDSPLGSWTADVMREATGADFAFQNPGGLRADLEAGPVTVGDVYEVMPFDNQIVTVRLTGDQVRELLENGVGPSTCVQVSGISFAFDPSRPRGQRVADVTLPGGRPLEPGRLYVVAVNDFMAQGGDGYRMLAEGKDLKDTGILVRNALERDVEKRTAAKKKLDAPAPGRIVNRRSTTSRPEPGAL